MEILLTPAEVIEGIEALEVLSKENIKGYRFHIARTLRSLRRAEELVKELRQELDDKHTAKDENGNPKIVGSGNNRIEFELVDQQAYREAIRGFYKDTIPVKVWQIPLDALEDTSLPAIAFWPYIVIT